MTEPCRICCDKGGQYNIFNDELSFDLALEVKKIKIYIVLNDFLYEKLYSKDEYSSSICYTCCSALCDAYTFMTQVRTAEKNQRLGIHQKPIAKSNLPSKAEEIKHDESEQTMETSEPLESSIEEEQCEEEIEMVALETDEYEVQESIIEEPPFEVPPQKRPKPAITSTGVPESIIVTHYELEQYKENDQNVISLNIFPLILDRVKDGYSFDVSWVSHSDSSSIYKCKHCIKAFSNAEFLLKHVNSSHHCNLCMYIAENYKDLGNHSKIHKTVTCHFCSKLCPSPSNFRQHLKKAHSLNLPLHVGVIADEFLK